MPTATHVRPSHDNDVPRGPSDRADLFYELLITLTEDGRFALDAKAIKAFRMVIDLTVGDYLAAEMNDTHKDLWKDKRFQKWCKMNVQKIARAARAKGGDRPSAEEIRDASNEVIRTAHDDYCANLPRSMVVPITRGPVCQVYVALLDNSSGNPVA